MIIIKKYNIITDQLYWSDQTYRIYGLSPNEFTLNLNKVVDLFHPEDKQMVMDEYNKTLQEKTDFDITHRIITNTGKIKHIIERAKTKYDKNGQPISSIGTVQDITILKEKELALIESQKIIQIREQDLKLAKERAEASEEIIHEYNVRLELAMEKANMAWWTMDIATGNVSFHKRKVEMLGYPPEKFTHYTDFTNLLHPEDYDQAMNAMMAHFEGRNDKYEVEYRIRTKAGTYEWFYDIGSIVKRDLNQKPLLITGLVLNITDRKKAEIWINKQNEQLKELNATKDKFFSIIAHDLRNPFGGIIGLSELMKTKLNEDNKEETMLLKYSQMIRTSAQSAFDLLDNLMQWAIAQSGVINVNLANISFDDILSSVIQLVSGSAFKKSISIEKFLTDSNRVYADESLVSTILRNLLMNAIKFTHKNGKITVSTQKKGDFLEISVTDTGVGMEVKNLDKIFRIDSKFSNLGTDKEKGTGLGLTLCKEFVEKQGGIIWVNSEIGKGSTFTFTLPLVEE